MSLDRFPVELEMEADLALGVFEDETRPSARGESTTSIFRRSL
jgi:hypothetical protein